MKFFAIAGVILIAAIALIALVLAIIESRRMKFFAIAGAILIPAIALIALILAIITIICLWPTQAPAQIWYYTPRPPIIQQTPAHARTYYYYRAHPYHYSIRPYGGYNIRPAWTNYRTLDTSWGYRTNRPRAKDLGIKGHKLTHPNPRSLYRPR